MIFSFSLRELLPLLCKKQASLSFLSNPKPDFMPNPK